MCAGANVWVMTCESRSTIAPAARDGVLPRGALVMAATARTGLGHVRRLGRLADSFRRFRPDLPIALLTNAARDRIPSNLAGPFDAIATADRADMSRALAGSEPSLVVVDTARVPDLDAVGARCALVLRQVVESHVPQFALQGRPWDLVIIPNPPDAWRPRLDARFTRSAVWAGWISEAVDRTGRGADASAVPSIVVTCGGSDRSVPEALVRSLVDGIRRQCEPLDVIELVGPGAAPVLDDQARVIRSAPDPMEIIASASLCISASGYNTVLDLARTDTPAVLIGKERRHDDQPERARQWGPRLGAVCLSPHDVADTVEWCRHTLAGRTRRAPIDLGPRGDDVAAERLARLIRVSRHGSRGEKRLLPRDRSGHALARLSEEMRARGAPTPRLDSPTPGTLTWRWQAGATAAELWRADAREASRDRLVSRIATAVRHFHVPSGGLGLDRYDPWCRVRSRVADLRRSHPELASVADALVSAIDARIHASWRVSEDGECVVHGDLHVGQLVVGPDGELSVIDLDDVARGRPECDLGNFIAHLETSTPEPEDADTRRRWRRVLPRAYREAGGTCDDDVLHAFAQASLVRRALKRFESNRDPEGLAGRLQLIRRELDPAR